MPFQQTMLMCRGGETGKEPLRIQDACSDNAGTEQAAARKQVGPAERQSVARNFKLPVYTQTPDRPKVLQLQNKQKKRRVLKNFEGEDWNTLEFWSLTLYDCTF